MAKSVTIVTHNGSFHADEVFAVATLRILLGREADITIKRSRDPEVWKTADYLVDVGGVYDRASYRFDHHQEGGAGSRSNGIDYSSFGLVWKEFGEIVCGGKEAADILDVKMVQPIDAIDNGQDIIEAKIPGVFPYDIGAVIASQRPSFQEDVQDYDAAFHSALGLALLILDREILHARGEVIGWAKTREMIKHSPDPRLSEVNHGLAWEPVTMDFPDLLYVYYQYDVDNWRLKAVRKRGGSFDARKDLPIGWAGKNGEDLQKITGVSDAVFCHRKRFLCGAKSKEGILKLAKLALEDGTS